MQDAGCWMTGAMLEERARDAVCMTEEMRRERNAGWMTGEMWRGLDACGMDDGS